MESTKAIFTLLSVQVMCMTRIGENHNCRKIFQSVGSSRY